MSFEGTLRDIVEEFMIPESYISAILSEWTLPLGCVSLTPHPREKQVP